MSKLRVGVTVIMPTFNRELFIESALRSIYNQTVSPKQVIVVDDGSTDNTASVVRRFDPAIQLISKPNGGKSTALNLGLTYATEDYVWIFDDDDIAAPNALELMCDELDRDTEAGFAYGAYSKFLTEDELQPYHNSPQLKDVALDNTYSQTLGLYLSLMFYNSIMQPGMLVRKRCYDQVGAFNEDLIRSQDYEMLLRLARRYKGCAIAAVIFHQRQHLGRRGSMKQPIEVENIIHSWISYDQNIFRAIHVSNGLSEFLPDGMQQNMSDDESVTARFVRGCIMGRRQIWDLAAEDFEIASNLCVSIGRKTLNSTERFAIRHLLDIRNFAPESVLTSSVFQTVLCQIPSWRLREEIRSSLLFPLPYVARIYFESRSLVDGLSIVKTYLALATPYSAMLNLIDKTKVKLSW